MKMARSSEHRQEVCAVILAAGFSKRFGSDKLLSDMGGRTVLQRSVENVLGTSVDKVAVVVPNDGKLDNYLPSSVHRIYNPERTGGISTSIAAGVNFFRNSANGILLMVADQPLVDSGTLDKLLSLFRENPSRIVACSVSGEIRNPMIFPARLFGSLASLKGDSGAKDLALSRVGELKTVEVDQEKLMDVDTIDDLKQVLSLIRK